MFLRITPVLFSGLHKHRHMNMYRYACTHAHTHISEMHRKKKSVVLSNMYLAQHRPWDIEKLVTKEPGFLRPSFQ